MSASTVEVSQLLLRRADAERNREGVLVHAARLLAEDPEITMAEIAAASGLGRTTLYRHFPTREMLIETLADRAVEEVEQTLAVIRRSQGTTTETLCRLIAAALSLGDRYRFLFAMESRVDQHRACESQLGSFLLELCERGQQSGEFSPYLSSVWMTSVVHAVVMLALTEVTTGRLEQCEAQRLMTTTVLHALDGRRGASDGVGLDFQRDKGSDT